MKHQKWLKKKQNIRVKKSPKEFLLDPLYWKGLVKLYGKDSVMRGEQITAEELEMLLHDTQPINNNGRR